MNILSQVAMQLIVFLVLIFSVIIHEIAHGYVAFLCGDNTAKNLGRITINPVKHIELFGTIILPLMLMLLGSSFLIGWAKPVPINPRNFFNAKRGLFFVSIAGVSANFLLALLFALLAKFVNLNSLLGVICYYVVFYNLFLGLFNLIPVPPLDGSRIVSVLISPKYAYQYNKLEPFGIFIVFLLLYAGLAQALMKIIVPVMNFLL